MKSFAPITISAFVLAGAIFLPAIAGAADDVLFVLEQSVQEKILGHIAPGKPLNAMFKTVATQSIDNKGNFGKVMHFEDRVGYALQDNGLSALASVGKFTSGEASNAARFVSLCGLVALVGESATSTNLENTTVLPIGKAFVPFGIKSTIESGRRARVKEFETSAKTLCSPIPGAEFSYRVVTELETKTSGMFGRTTSVSMVEENKCRSSADFQPAAQFSPAIPGDALLISCERSDKSGAKKRVEYLYAKNFAFFFNLGEASDVQSIKVQYNAVEPVQ